MGKIVDLNTYRNLKDVKLELNEKKSNIEYENKYIKALKNTPQDILKEMEELLEN